VVVETKGVPAETRETQREVVHEDTGRRFDPNAVFELDLNSDSEEE
jgi:mediator of RNA polymerase II transcription subunit 4